MTILSKTISLALVAIAGLSSGCTCAEEILVATGEYPPYTEEAARGGGVVNTIVTEAFRRKGVTVKYSFMPWKRSMEETRRGAFAASSFWFKNAEREKEFVFSNSFISAREVFFYRKAAPINGWNKLSDLSEKRIGLTRGYTYTTELWDLVNSQKLQGDEATTDEQGLHKLLAGRVDLMVVDELVGWRLLADPNLFARGASSLVAVLPKAFSEAKGYLLFPKNGNDTAALLQKFNAGLGEMQKDGSLSRLQESLHSAY
jgi:polar amino acid transport system substrate-binding protein